MVLDQSVVAVVIWGIGSFRRVRDDYMAPDGHKGRPCVVNALCPSN